ncbi:hypothetical protein LTR05_003754 [Lithohypha guttulata]|uniref:Uncharacterized protein n=1 Tax=Lithohypha guttulata TaxID=1690604 RepID=A0AAN7T0K9_9EURO|nr:hypothetical protein LTR05_003754 [Lithohypha guttulata]
MADPDVVVGIDFGMTSTGVAYSAGPDWPRPDTIQNWPGNARGSIADKVDSKVAYTEGGEIAAWGFAADEGFGIDSQRCEEFFKLYLDPEFRDAMEDAPSLQEARRWFTDYLSCLYRTVDRHMNDTIPKYSSKRVEFKFSVPTTWKNPAMIAETEQLIRNAGFARGNPLHTAEISLTEAEAAAVYASKMQYAAGDIFLVCDAGGGTSDVNILKVISSGIGQTELAPLSWVEGRAIGSTLIDFRVEKLIVERLQVVRDQLQETPEVTARRMLREGSRFESFKCNLGDEAMDLPTLRLTIPGIAPGLDVPPHIENSQIVLDKREIESIFDAQVERICDLIDDQLYQLEKAHPHEIVNFLVLSGGLGSSAYLQQSLRRKYLLGRSPHACIKDLQILRVPKPQLAVCHGLVLDRVQQIKESRVVYKERFCRNSYGVVVKAEYDPQVHYGEPTSFDHRDKKTYVLNQIDWFIKQGQKVSVSDGVKQHYSLKVLPGQENQPWTTQVVMSTLSANELPSSLNKPGANRLCKVESSLPSEMKLKNRHWYSGGSQYHRAEFDVQVIVGAADLKFRTLGTEGRTLSRAHDTIDVEWYSSRTSNKVPGAVISELGAEGLDRHIHPPRQAGLKTSDSWLRRFNKKL